MSKVKMSRGVKVMSKIMEVDRGWVQLEFKVASLKKEFGVAVGINREQGEVIHNRNMNVATLAHIHEFGRESANVPMRSFLRSTADKLKFWNSKRFRDQVGNIVTGGGSRLGVLMLMGDITLEAVKRDMRKGIPPELSEITIADKKKKKRKKLTALFDTQKLYKSLGMKIGPREMFMDMQ